MLLIRLNLLLWCITRVRVNYAGREGGSGNATLADQVADCGTTHVTNNEVREVIKKNDGENAFSNLDATEFGEINE